MLHRFVLIIPLLIILFCWAFFRQSSTAYSFVQHYFASEFVQIQQHKTVTVPSKQAALERVSSHVLSDPAMPIEWLVEVISLNDGSILAADRQAAVVRRFKPDGSLIGYIVPPGQSQDNRNFLGVAYSRQNQLIWLQDRRGTIFNFRLDSKMPAQIALKNSHIPFAASPLGSLYSLFPISPAPPYHCIQLMAGGRVSASFLPADASAVYLKFKYSIPSVAFDAKGNIYAMRRLDPTVFHYSPDGAELARWRLQPNKSYRPFKADINPTAVSRDPNVIQAWERTFTRFNRIEYIDSSGLLCILFQNNPPKAPNTLEFYDSGARFYGSIIIDGYLVGQDNNGHLYISNQWAIINDQCILTKYKVVLK